MGLLLFGTSVALHYLSWPCVYTDSPLAIVYGICSFVEGTAIPGWTSLLVSLWFIGGAILLACGIIGEYVGKIYKEVKRRPRYFVEKTILPKEKTEMSAYFSFCRIWKREYDSNIKKGTASQYIVKLFLFI